MFRLTQATLRPSESVLHRGLVQPAVVSRNFHTTRWCLDEKKPSKEEDPVSFRLSLYQSTFDRIQRERADSDRFATIRNITDTGGFGATVAYILRRYSIPIDQAQLLTRW